ncbi:hypothetical protein ACFHWD_04155 [Clostridium sp. MT-14]|uniref:hypothetical protein n=1 Tax=Clostridium sp. MT-14 TaxID=3348360 RepID=UPI0035F40AF5
MSDIIAGNDVVIVNLDELADLIAAVLSNDITVNIGDVTVNTDDLENLLTQINNKIPQPIDLAGLESVLNNLNVTIQGLSQQLGISGENKGYGQSLSIPATVGDYEIDFTVNEDGFLTDIVYSLSAWNYNDTWDLLINDIKIFSNMTTKEFGENKHFEKYKDISKDDIIKIIFHNTSGGNKILWVDINVLENNTV